MPWFYRFARWPARFVAFQCVREVTLGREQLDVAGGRVLAVTHLSHLEPVVVGLHTPRHISWVARIEFYRRGWAGWVLRAIHAIPVNRQGVNVSTVRTAIARLTEGEFVGIFPEGGVARGQDSIFRNGLCKGGACVIAQRAGVPIIPVVIIGVENLNSVGPFLPFRRGRVFTAYGAPVLPDTAPGNPRERRARFARRLQAEFVATYQRLLAETGHTDADVP